MSLSQALAALDSATTDNHLGSSHVIDGQEVICVKRGLTVEETAQWSAGLGMSVEGVRLTVNRRLLPYVPGRRNMLTVDGAEYEVAALAESGNRLRLTLVRMVAR